MYYINNEFNRELIQINILIIEDDIEINGILKEFLETENFDITSAYDGEMAKGLFVEKDFDLILLDLMIPKISGMEILKYIRKNSMVPIIIISAKDSDSDKTLGLGLGADDYITKPFSITEVLARIKANIRRNTAYVNLKEDKFKNEISHRDIVLNLEDYSVKSNDENIELTYKEFEILRLLMENPNRVYTKKQIYMEIWKEEYFNDENAINVHISRLRNKIEKDPKNPEIVVTVWGIGYKLGEIDE